MSTLLETTAEAHSPARPGDDAERLARLLATVVLYAAPALICAQSARVIDPDIWWHLRTAEWIAQHHTVPQFDSFSTVSAGHPWQGYSWLFELLILGPFKRLGLVGIVAYSSGMVLAITVALHRMIRRLQSDSSIAIGLTFLATLALGHLFTPRPWLFSILFFVLELDILMQARATGRPRELSWLPLIFGLWANMHIQFVLGLALLGLWLTESLIGRAKIRPQWLALTLAACVLATLANPYGWRIYAVAASLVQSPGGADVITELHAMLFRDVLDFAVLGLAMGAAAALGRSRRWLLLETALLAFAAYLSFHSQRDVWAVVVVAAAILAAGIKLQTNPVRQQNRTATFAAIAAAGFLVWVGFPALQVNEPRLKAQLAQAMPVDAADFVRSQNLTGPIYSNFTWGGYLGWKLRMPVSIDSRGGLHGDAAIDRSVATWAAEPGWDLDERLTQAKLIIGPVNAPLVQALRRDPRFALEYEDGLAAVFTNRGKSVVTVR